MLAASHLRVRRAAVLLVALAGAALSREGFADPPKPGGVPSNAMKERLIDSPDLIGTFETSAPVANATFVRLQLTREPSTFLDGTRTRKGYRYTALRTDGTRDEGQWEPQTTVTSVEQIALRSRVKPFGIFPVIHVNVSLASCVLTAKTTAIVSGKFLEVSEQLRKAGCTSDIPPPPVEPLPSGDFTLRYRPRGTCQVTTCVRGKCTTGAISSEYTFRQIRRGGVLYVAFDGEPSFGSTPSYGAWEAPVRSDGRFAGGSVRPGNPSLIGSATGFGTVSVRTLTVDGLDVTHPSNAEVSTSTHCAFGLATPLP